MLLSRFKLTLFLGYVISILFVPRLSTLLGEGIQRNLRAEDILLPFMIITCILSLRKRTLVYSQGLILYILYALAITFFGIATLTLPPKAILIWGKEFQYIVGFILLVDCLNRDNRYIRYFEWTILVACIISAIYFIYRLQTFEWSGYGVTHFTERVSPSLTSWLYFNLFFWALVLKHHQSDQSRSYFFSLLIIILFFAVLAGGTRTMFICLPIFLLIYWGITLPVKKMVTFSTMLFIILFSFYLSQDQVVDYLYSKKAETIAMPLARFRSVFNLPRTLGRTRIHSWGSVIENAYYSGSIIFGGGRGYSHLDESGFMPSLGLGADNQYTVNLSEVGVVGTFLLILSIIYLFFHIHKSLWKFYLPYLIVYFTGGMTCEIFQLSKSGQLFWISTGYFIVWSETLKCTDNRSNPLVHEAETYYSQDKVALCPSS